MSDNDRVTSQQMAAARQALGITQHQAAQLAGVTQPTWSRMERGEAIRPSEPTEAGVRKVVTMAAAVSDDPALTGADARDLLARVEELLVEVKSAIDEGEGKIQIPAWVR